MSYSLSGCGCGCARCACAGLGEGYAAPDEDCGATHKWHAPSASCRPTTGPCVYAGQIEVFDPSLNVFVCKCPAGKSPVNDAVKGPVCATLGGGKPKVSTADAGSLVLGAIVLAGAWWWWQQPKGGASADRSQRASDWR